MTHQPLPELINQAQQLLTQIRQHPQYKKLQIDCDVTVGDVSQFFNTLQWSATAGTVDTSRAEFFQ
ncbi:hypothetical protein [Nodularia sp. LEGE 04288]|uniref:hypothetical protein n=1 Tax=Nodularia sp. LEGE 04288 TaxID=1828639 RepID=UPI001D12D43E|nr:hypothetical protein [Nodularia sp. LEGE 04288]MCC2695226.1 hypothetical protein [Nodularia sp. LEGE 04288]